MERVAEMVTTVLERYPSLLEDVQKEVAGIQEVAGKATWFSLTDFQNAGLTNELNTLSFASHVDKIKDIPYYAQLLDKVAEAAGPMGQEFRKRLHTALKTNDLTTIKQLMRDVAMDAAVAQSQLVRGRGVKPGYTMGRPGESVDHPFLKKLDEALKDITA